MRWTVMALFVMLLATAAAAQDKAADARGQKVFTDSKCLVCHLLAGQGNKKGASLDKVGATLTPEEIRQWITNAPEMAAKAKIDRKPPMKAFTDLSKEDVDSLVAYLTTLKK